MLKLVYIAVCQLVGFTSGMATAQGLKTWYPTLRKPSFTPPGWVFGPVWTVLYLLMALAAARVHGDPLCRGLFFMQLGLNALWSPLFFAFRRPDLAMLDLLALWALVAMCIHAFGAVDSTAAALLWPYWAWVSFASVLNFEIWRLNRRL